MWNLIRTKLSAIYAFIHYMVDKKILPYELLHKKSCIKSGRRLFFYSGFTRCNRLVQKTLALSFSE